MVKIYRDSTRQKKGLQRYSKAIFLFSGIAAFIIWVILPQAGQDDEVVDLPASSPKFSHEISDLPMLKQDSSACPYVSLNDLKESELHPRADSRHMIDPPADQDLTLVCCNTTVGPWNILVHHAWAPNGAARFLDMVRSGYFNEQRVPLMRCVSNFICQFGLAGSASRKYAETLPDDPNWLPEGKEHRENEQGVKRFAQGYLAYAGGGPHTRDNQFIVALKGNGPLAGGSPWEVPWGELVGDHSFQTLSKIYTGYGEKGPSQGKLWKQDYLQYVEQDFPLLDFIDSCDVIDEKKSA